tara:strand:- start:130 stop:1224 length:1095 start_codon:yes stop_codon:yes gene_type:complete
MRDFVARVDLTSIGSGNQQVPVIVEVSDPAVEIVRITPATVSVTIDPFEVRAIEVTARLESAPVIGFRAELNEVAANPAIVQVSGGASDIAEVAEVIANVSLDGATREVSTQTLLVPVNRQGDEITNVIIDPQTAQVSVPVTRITSRKRVPVVPEIDGNVAAGFFISQISITPTTVEIEGQPEALERVNSVSTSDLAVSGARADIEAEVTFSEPSDITVLSERPTARVVVVVQPLNDTATIQAAVVIENLPSTQVARVAEPSVQVVVGGAAEVLRLIRVGDIVAEVDASNLGPGKHKVRPVITVPLGIEVARVEPLSVTVNIESGAPLNPAPRITPLVGPGGAVAPAQEPPKPSPTPVKTSAAG